MSKSKLRQEGFTLVEVLVAFLIFAIIGLVSSQLLSQTVSSQETLTERGNRLNDIHRAMHIVQRDLLQWRADRFVRNEFGDTVAPLLINADGVIELTRVGWRNPLQLPRAEVQRVAYRWQEDTLERAYWATVDRPQGAEPIVQTLLEDVVEVEFVALDVSGNEYTIWPSPAAASGGVATQLAAVLMRIELEPFGVIERIWELPGV